MQLQNSQFVPFKSKNKFVNLLFRNTKVSNVTFKKSIILFIIFGCLFLSLSIYLFIQMSKIIQITKQYYKSSQQISCQMNQQCSKIINVQYKMQGPVYLLYQVDNFYQNFRSYIRSKNIYQLAGNQINSDQASNCHPFITNAQLNVNISWNGTELERNQVASPCGAIAMTYFTDTFRIFDSTGTQLFINETGIAPEGQQGTRYKRTPNSAEKQWINPQNQHFIVWMHNSGLPNFRKIWGKIENGLQIGNYRLMINYNYNSSLWDGSRTIILTTKGIFGGKNYLLPVSFLLLGVVSIIIIILFFKKTKEIQNYIKHQN